jgi:dipeptidyl-peptidase 4
MNMQSSPSLVRTKPTRSSAAAFAIAILILLGLSTALVDSPATAAEPEPVTRANYQQAFHYSTAFLQPFLYDTAVTPNWIGKTDSFWYSYRTSQGTCYWRVDPTKGTRVPLFDGAKLATLLSEVTQKPLEAAQLPLTRVSVNSDGNRMKFVVDDMQYEYELQRETLSRLGKAPPQAAFAPGEGRGGFRRGGQQQERGDQQQRQRRGFQQGDQQQRQSQQERGQGGLRASMEEPLARGRRVFSPDRSAYVFVRNHNLYLGETANRPFNGLMLPTWQPDFTGFLAQLWMVRTNGSLLEDSRAIQLSTDGEDERSFGSMGTYGAGMDDQVTPPRVEWSADSKAFYATRVDGRGVKELFVVNSLSMPRPTLEKYRYPLPGEPAARRMELFVCQRSTRKLTRIGPHWPEEVYSDIHWGKASNEIRFVRRDRLVRHGELCAADVATGVARCLIHEQFDNADIRFQPVHYIEGSDEMIWWSERSGWGHYYLYDRGGKLKSAITSGPYRASRIVAVDPKNRLLFFEANAREPGENVYFQHLYCAHLDGTRLTLMDPGDANHQSELAPSHRFVVDNCSRVDLAPVSILRDAAGRQILKLEKADLSGLQAAGWKMPERFIVKAADGVTDLYGNLWKPFDLDPKKKYAVIVHVYPGPQQEGVTHVFSAISPDQQLAQLGFLVIQVGNRGGSPQRSKAYSSYGYFNLRDYGLADKKTAVEQLAARFPYLDIDRVGIYGHSGGAFMSAAAVLQKPYNEFFKAAVASSGNHDNNIYNNGWAERYHGMKATEPPSKSYARNKNKEPGEPDFAPPLYEIKVPTNAELAANLQGALLLVHGDIDNNVHPASTLRLVDALIKANKRFDMLILPGKRHGYGDGQAYFQQRLWDFFADHLLGDRQTGADIYEKSSRH